MPDPNPRGIVVRTYHHMLAVSDYAGRPDVFVLTAPGAAGYMGPKALKALVDIAPGISAIIDCDDDPGLALRALACGWRYLMISGPRRDAITSAASALGVRVLAPEDIGDRLTLALDRDEEPALGDFLKS